MMEAKTSQVLSVSCGGRHFVCIFYCDSLVNPYKLYCKWYDHGWHRKKVAEYGDFSSVLFYLVEQYS